MSGEGNSQDPQTAEEDRPLTDWPLDKFLDRLPLFASIVCGGERMRGASDEMLQAWAWGIEDATKHAEQLIAQWRLVHGKP